jgi:hypothetical protein
MLSRWSRIRAFLARLPFIGRLFPSHWFYLGASISVDGQTRTIIDHDGITATINGPWDTAPAAHTTFTIQP